MSEPCTDTPFKLNGDNMNSNKSILNFDKEIYELDAKPGQKLRLYIMLNIADNLRWISSHLSKISAFSLHPSLSANPNSSNGSEETGIGDSDSPMQNKEVAKSIANILEQVENFNSEIDTISSEMDDIKRDIEDHDHEHEQYAMYDDLTTLEDTVSRMKEEFTNPTSVEIKWS